MPGEAFSEINGTILLDNQLSIELVLPPGAESAARIGLQLLWCRDGWRFPQQPTDLAIGYLELPAFLLSERVVLSAITV